MLTDLSCLASVHNPTSPPSSKTAPPLPGASQTIKSTIKRSPKSPNKKKTKKVIESEEITEGRKMTDVTKGGFWDKTLVGGRLYKTPHRMGWYSESLKAHRTFCLLVLIKSKFKPKYKQLFIFLIYQTQYGSRLTNFSPIITDLKKPMIFFVQQLNSVRYKKLYSYIANICKTGSGTYF